MSYMCKHIIRFEDDSMNTVENLARLNEAFASATPYGRLETREDALCDSNWNFGDGLTWYDMEPDMEAVSSKLPGDVILVETYDDNPDLTMGPVISRHMFLDGETVYQFDESYDSEDIADFLGTYNQA